MNLFASNRKFKKQRIPMFKYCAIYKGLFIIYLILFSNYLNLHAQSVSVQSYGMADTITVSGSSLYGTIFGKGGGDVGSIIKVNTDGSGYNTLFSFPTDTSRGVQDLPVGGWPNTSLVVSGSTIFGTTEAIGYHVGTIFKLNTDGSGFTSLYQFPGGSAKALLLVGSTIYGSTTGNGSGSIFSINTDGSNYKTLHIFNSSSDGLGPSSLIESGSILYGTTRNYGGDSANGTIFKINNDGTGFAKIHTFDVNIDSSTCPVGPLTISGDTLFGVTFGTSNNQGIGDNGGIFKINVDGSSFSTIHTFAGSSWLNLGQNPISSVTLSGTTLYGTSQGGANHAGTIYSINTDGTAFNTWFSGTSSSSIDGPVIIDGSNIYSTGTGTNSSHVVFSITGIPVSSVPEPSTYALLGLGLATLLAVRRKRIC